MKHKYTTGIILSFLATIPAVAQTTATPVDSKGQVTEIITDYNGFWQSGTGQSGNAAINPISPDNSHNLLAFVVNSGVVSVNGSPATLQTKYFSTGANDDLLRSKGISFIPSKYQALQIASLSDNFTINTKVGLGEMYDGVHNGISTPPPPVKDGQGGQYLTDGLNGLNLGTGIANIPGTITFNVNSIQPESIGDGVPDVLITQIAAQSLVDDVYQFLGADGNLVADSRALSATYTNVAVVGNWMADFYESTNSSVTIYQQFINTSRPLRLLSIDFSEFGITASNYKSIKQFQIKLSGESDLAFVAYNTNAANIGSLPLPVQLVSFTGQAKGGKTHLSWKTASELSSAYFDVETSSDGHNFKPVGRVAAAGTSTQAHTYSFDYQSAQSGLEYYRLHLVDTDGTGTYSSVVAVQTEAGAVSVYPNPVTDQLTLTLPNLSQATLTLFAADGRLVWQHQITNAPTQQLSVPGIASLAPGLYLLRTQIDGQTKSYSIVKQ